MREYSGADNWTVMGPWRGKRGPGVAEAEERWVAKAMIGDVDWKGIWHR